MALASPPVPADLHGRSIDGKDLGPPVISQKLNGDMPFNSKKISRDTNHLEGPRQVKGL
jgi:hypothetical protein